MVIAPLVQVFKAHQTSCDVRRFECEWCGGVIVVVSPAPQQERRDGMARDVMQAFYSPSDGF